MHCKPHTLHHVALLLLLALFAAGTLQASDRWETLQAINWVENPRNSPKAGPCGELGPYQFRLSTWSMHTDKPFALAVERPHADEVAVRHYEWIRRGLQSSGVAATPYNIALAWNAGLEATISGRAPVAAYRYANQVHNLVQDLKSRQYAGTR